ncbi:MAG: bifunctional DNase/RNase [Sphingobacteriales bacterium]|jgi:bifunctional DNase/RNase
MGGEKIQLEIVGLSYSQGQAGAYALMLSESKGGRKLPIVIGAPEAQAIAIELEGMTPSRPLTHDLFRNFSEAFGISLKEVFIYRLEEGIFYAKLVCELNGKMQEIDSRSSDAIALAVRFKCPIFTNSEIMNSAGFVAEEKKSTTAELPGPVGKPTEKPIKKASKKTKSELEKQLQKALEKEDYEMASKLRDAINLLDEEGN